MAKCNSSLDYQFLENSLTKKRIKLADVKDQIVKVAFDLCKFKNSDTGANLWKIESGEDGQEYLVALYDPNSEVTTKEAWEVKLNKNASCLQFTYKEEPICLVKTASLGIPPEELESIEEYLPRKLASNKKLVTSLLSTLADSTKKQLLNKYPELAPSADGKRLA